MKTIKVIIVMLLSMTLLFSVGCTKKQFEEGTKKVISMGKMEDNTYTNDYFGLTFKVPDDWTIASEEEKEMLTEASQEAITEKNEELGEQLDLAKVKTLNLVFAFKHPLTYTEGYNPSLICIGENLGLLGGMQVKSGKDYLTLTKSSLEQTQLPYTLGEITNSKLDDKDFYIMDTGIEYAGLNIKQKYYSTVIEGYALNFIVSYSNEDELKELNSILETVKFD